MNEIGPCQTVIVGAGPAGLAAGIAAARTLGENVYVLEKNSEPGRKFLLSGSGQCNVTHGGAIADILSRYGDKKSERFVTPALYAFDNQATVRYFEQRGVPMEERDDGKIFPRSLKSRDLLEVLLGDLRESGAELRTDTNAESVDFCDGFFFLKTTRECFKTKKLILSTGGCSYPKTGSTGQGVRFAERFGHRIVPPRPALTPVYVGNYAFADCSGIAFRDLRIEHLRNGKRCREGRGDVLLTHHGLSGPGILDLSRGIEAGDTLHLAVCDAVNLQPFLTGKKTLKNALAPALNLPERFLSKLLEFLELSPEQPAAELDRSGRKRLESALAGLPFIVDRLGGWNEAMATAGGVALEEVDRRTMESRLVPGLFFCGEVLDVDGDTGGYNIQFAISSGFLAGRSATGR